MSAGLSPTRRPWDSAPGFVDCPLRGRGQDRVGQSSLLEGPLSECFLKKGSQEEAVSLKPSRDHGSQASRVSPNTPGKPWKLPRYGNRGKTAASRRRLQEASFSTVPTALGKLLRTEFPTVPTASTAEHTTKPPPPASRGGRARFAGSSQGIEMTRTGGYNY